MLPKGGHFFQVNNFLAMFFSHVKIAYVWTKPNAETEQYLCTSVNLA